MRILDVGCGMRKHKDAIGIDFRRVKGVDIIADATFLARAQLLQPSSRLLIM
jgi:hypothetical protein